MSSSSNITVIIPTRDEAVHLPHSLGSVAGWVDLVHVIDSESTDDTRKIAEDGGAVVTVKPWLGYARQKNWALDNLELPSDWVFILDADEIVMPELKAELLALAARPPDQVREAGFFVNRYFYFMGRCIRHCGYQPAWNLRFFKRGRARYEEREVHEHMIVDGPTGYLKGTLHNVDRKGLEVYMAKHNRYSTLEARELIREQAREAGAGDGTGGGGGHVEARLFGTWDQRRRWVKRHVYHRLPARWLLRFVHMYFIRLGFLDGVTGFRFCLFMATYELLVTLKLIELRQEDQEGGGA